MQRSIPCRRAVTALLAALIVTIAAVPVVASNGSTMNTPEHVQYLCPPMC